MPNLMATKTQPNLIGSDSSEWLWGNESANRIWGYGGNDNIYGGYGDDTLFGGDGNDVVRGAADDDILVGGRGADILTGGTQEDRFVFQFSDGPYKDVIRDFTLDSDTLVLEENLFVTDSRIANLDGDRVKDTVLTLNNGGTIWVLGVSKQQNWDVGGGNVEAIPTGDPLFAAPSVDDTFLF